MCVTSLGWQALSDHKSNNRQRPRLTSCSKADLCAAAIRCTHFFVPRLNVRNRDRPAPAVYALITACALFAIAAWTRLAIGRVQAARQSVGLRSHVKGSRALALDRHTGTVDQQVEARRGPETDAQGPSSPTASTGELCALTRPTPRRPDEPRIAAAITTSRRPLLFRRAMLSFRMRCLDCSGRIDAWFAVDDGSSPEQLAETQAAVPGLTWGFKRHRRARAPILVECAADCLARL